MKIKQTRKYDQFVSEQTNRPITSKDGRTMDLLRQSMKKYGFLPFPILVLASSDSNGPLRIIDGNHRYTIAKELGLPILYVETDRYDIVIAETAAGQSPWKLNHYVASFAAQGKENYVKLMEFCEQTELPISCAASMLYGQSASSNNANVEIKAGSFKIRSLDAAKRVSAIASAISNYVDWAYGQKCLGALSRFVALPAFSDDRMIKKIEAHNNRLRKCATLEECSDMLSDLYNHASSEKIPLSFYAREAAAGRSATKPNMEKK